MAKKIIKKTSAKAATPVAKKEAPAKKAAPAKKEAAKKTTAPKKAKVDRTLLANITTADDLYALIRDNYNANSDNDKTIDKKLVEGVMNAFKDSFESFVTKSDAEKATFLLPEIGRFTAFISPAHDSINPKTGETVAVPEKKRIRFKVFKSFTDKIND